MKKTLKVLEIILLSLIFLLLLAFKSGEIRTGHIVPIASAETEIEANKEFDGYYIPVDDIAEMWVNEYGYF